MLCFGLGLMAKPMLVTLPFVLLLLDYWPLKRAGVKRLVLEKLPLLALALAAGVLTILTQRHGTAVRSLEELSLHARLGNAVVSYVIYLKMLLWPYPLAVFYPHPEEAIALWQVAGSAVILVLLTILAFVLRRRAPYLLVGWLWYIITLGPVSGVLQAGWQGRADRFLYVPSIGLFMLAVWGLADLLQRRRLALGVAGGTIVAACACGTILQLRHWTDSLTLWEHTAAVTEDNFTARDSLAAVLLAHGRVDEAIEHLRQARVLRPNHELSHYLLGLAYRQQNRLEESTQSLTTAVRVRPECQEAHAVLAEVLADQNRFAEAEQHAQTALELDPSASAGPQALGAIRLRQGRRSEARELFRKALCLEPHSQTLQNHLKALE
jgi:Flp pilus assembly protein TadD